MCEKTLICPDTLDGMEQKGKHVWLDGVCKKCGCIVIECSSKHGRDYMNSCANPKCENFGWHCSYDDESQDYYKHDYDARFIPLICIHKTDKKRDV